MDDIYQIRKKQLGVYRDNAGKRKLNLSLISSES